MTDKSKKSLLRRLSKITCAATVFLIFAGGLVTSTGSGLSVPDWPLSYGMVFPPMVGGVFYEHGHRMIATCAGFLMLLQTILTAIYEKRTWVKNLSFFALGSVIIQGILGGITVKFFLPLWVSVSHGILAQTFLLMTVILAYSFSKEREKRPADYLPADRNILWCILGLIILIYLQLMVGAIMRHSHSGLAIMDFPTMGGKWWPRFDQDMLDYLNSERFDHGIMETITLGQVAIHFLHRLGAMILLAALFILNYFSFETSQKNACFSKTLFTLNTLFISQIVLGIITILSAKEYHFTSLHVVTGAIILGWTVLLFLRASPVELKKLKKILLGRT